MTTVQYFADRSFTGVEFMFGDFEAHEFGLHEHDEYMFGIVDRGALTLQCRGRETQLSPGSVVLMNPGDPHSGKSGAEGWACRDIRLRPDAFCALSGLEAPVRFPYNVVRCDATRARIASAYVALAEARESMTRESAVISLLKYLLETRLVERKDDGGPAPRGKISQVRELIDEEFASDVSISDLARRIQMNPNYIITAFKEEFGITPRKYLISRRLAYAKNIIRKGASLADAAGAAGFFDQSHLTRAFRTEFGYAPSTYKRAHKRRR